MLGPSLLGLCAWIQMPTFVSMASLQEHAYIGEMLWQAMGS